MSTNPLEVSGGGETGGEPAMVTDSSGVYVAQNEDKVYEQADWEWLEASQFVEEG